MASRPPESDWRDYVQRHLQFAWWSLLFFLAIGILLEGLHGFKVPWYLDVGMENRRLMWTLGHSSGSILALLHGAFAATIYALPRQTAFGRWLASPMLMGSSLLLPGGFFVGGFFLHNGEAGLGLIFLVPIGMLLLLIAVTMTAWTVSART